MKFALIFCLLWLGHQINAECTSAAMQTLNSLAGGAPDRAMIRNIFYELPQNTDTVLLGMVFSKCDGFLNTVWMTGIRGIPNTRGVIVSLYTALFYSQRIRVDGPVFTYIGAETVTSLPTSDIMTLWTDDPNPGCLVPPLNSSAYTAQFDSGGIKKCGDSGVTTVYNWTVASTLVQMNDQYPVYNPSALCAADGSDFRSSTGISCTVSVANDLSTTPGDCPATLLAGITPTWIKSVAPNGNVILALVGNCYTDATDTQMTDMIVWTWDGVAPQMQRRQVIRDPLQAGVLDSAVTVTQVVANPFGTNGAVCPKASDMIYETPNCVAGQDFWLRGVAYSFFSKYTMPINPADSYGCLEAVYTLFSPTPQPCKAVVHHNGTYDEDGLLEEAEQFLVADYAGRSYSHVELLDVYENQIAEDRLSANWSVMLLLIDFQHFQLVREQRVITLTQDTGALTWHLAFGSSDLLWSTNVSAAATTAQGCALGNNGTQFGNCSGSHQQTAEIYPVISPRINHGLECQLGDIVIYTPCPTAGPSAAVAEDKAELQDYWEWSIGAGVLMLGIIVIAIITIVRGKRHKPYVKLAPKRSSSNEHLISQKEYPV